MTLDLEALKRKWAPDSLLAGCNNVERAEVLALINELTEARNCGEAEPVSGCDCRRCLVHAAQRAYLAQLDAEAALANARVAAMEEAAQIVPAVLHPAWIPVQAEIRRRAPLPPSVVCVPRTQMRGLLEYAHQHGAAGFDSDAWGPVFAALGMEPL